MKRSQTQQVYIQLLLKFIIAYMYILHIYYLVLSFLLMYSSSGLPTDVFS